MYESFAMMADGLFYELGIRVPEIRLAASDNIEENAFAFRMNGNSGPTHKGLQLHELLVNDTPERLGRLLEVAASRRINPANNTECSIIKLLF